MNWVDVTQDLPWTHADLERRSIAVLESRFPDAAKLQRRAAVLGTATGFLSEDEKNRWNEYNATARELEMQVETEWAQAQLVQQAWSVEAAQHALLALPDEEENAEARAPHLAVIAAASAQVMELVALRDRVHPPEPEEAPDEQ